MDYFTLLNMNREPFSNSPDPHFFFQSRQHVDCLQKLELALRLKRGLNIIIGAVGAGKTTLGRKLLNKLSSDDAIDTHLVLDPSFGSPLSFLAAIGSLITGDDLSGESEHGCRSRGRCCSEFESRQRLKVVVGLATPGVRDGGTADRWREDRSRRVFEERNRKICRSS